MRSITSKNENHANDLRNSSDRVISPENVIICYPIFRSGFEKVYIINFEDFPIIPELEATSLQNVVTGMFHLEKSGFAILI